MHVYYLAVKKYGLSEKVPKMFAVYIYKKNL